MALYQPTNVIPSSYTKGTVDVNETMEISWQVNGNSAMTAFQIDFYLNDANSTYITSTGRLEDNCPFYGTDRFGRPQLFTWNAAKTWGNWSLNKLINGNEYRYKITQWYKDNPLVGGDVTLRDDAPLKSGKTYRFHPFLTVDGERKYLGYVIFTPNDEEIKYMTNPLHVYYDFTNQKGWYVANGILRLMPMSVTQTYPNGSIPLHNGSTHARISDENFLMQYSSNVFVTNQVPTLILYKTDSAYKNKVLLPNILETSVSYFQADYQQDQDIPIRWIRWQVATANNGNVGEILADTGDIYTPTLNYEYNGFFNGRQYAIRAIGESESGQECNSNPDTDGWIFFNISIENQGEYSGDFTVQCLNKENATLLEWEGVEVISPTTSPQGYEPQIANGTVTLLPKDGDTEYSVTWNEQIVYDTESRENKTIPMDFPAQWTAVWNGNVGSGGKKNISLIITPIEPLPSRLILGLPITSISSPTAVPVDGGNYYVASEKVTTTKTVLGVTLGNISSAVHHGQAIYNADTGNITVILLCTAPNASVSATVNVNYTEEFKGETNHTMPGRIIDCSVISYSNNAVERPQCFASGNSLTVIGIAKAENLAAVQPISVELSIEYWNVDEKPFGKLFAIGQNQDNEIVLSKTNGIFSLIGNELEDITLEIPQNSAMATMIITPSSFCALFFLVSGRLNGEPTVKTLEYTQQPITSVSIYGGDSGATVDSVSVYKGDGSDILSLYESPDFEPVWNSDQYELYMTANFNGNLEGGTGTATGSGFRVYRQEVGKNVLTPIATVPSTTTSIKDYGIVSRKAYKYSLYAYDNNGAFMSAVENEKVVATCFKNYSLLVCDYDEENDEYHVRKQYLFALNLSTGSVGNNNSPTLNANFTRYPTRMPSMQNYASGTLQGLIGAIYTVPALIEQIGNYKWTAKPSTLDYFDSVDLEQELYDLSTAPYQLFLRDMKGRLRMVVTNGAITMTTNIKQKQQSISISFPWVEIGDASDVTIIQTPDDYGWNNDNQVLDVSLDVDVETGELSATYPYPYKGTKFYLTGVNKETLTTKTPLGITPAQFELSETATQPDDGELAATVKVNSEES